MTEKNKQELNDNARLRAILDTAVDGIITIDERGTVEAANPAAERLFGYASSEMIGHNINMLMPAPYREEHDGYLANYVRTGEQKIIGSGREVEAKRKDGSTFPVYLAVSEVRFDDRRIFTGFVHDLSDLKRAEERATQLGRILETSLNEIFVFDAQTYRFLFVNRGALTNIGHTAEAMSSMTPLDIKPAYSREQFDQLVHPLLTGERSEVVFETVHQRRNSSLYSVHIRLQLATWEGCQAIVAIILDITERKKVEDQLATLNAELEERVELRTKELRDTQAQLVRREKLATLGQLAGGVAHEIRNPLGVIKNSAYFLKMISDSLSEAARECVDEIDREVATANRIVSELLDFTRDLPLRQAERFQLDAALATAQRAAALPEGVIVEMDKEETDKTLLGDQGQIERVLTNLIRNASQAMFGEGMLTISVQETSDHAIIHVQDTGVGIPPDDLANVFEPLFTTKAKGIGLGLAVSRRYAQRNGGSLTVDSTVGEGTTFHFSVPLGKRQL